MEKLEGQSKSGNGILKRDWWTLCSYTCKLYSMYTKRNKCTCYNVNQVYFWKFFSKNVLVILVGQTNFENLSQYLIDDRWWDKVPSTGKKLKQRDSEYNYLLISVVCFYFAEMNLQKVCYGNIWLAVRCP